MGSKKLTLTVEVNNGDLSDIYFDITLVVDKDNNLFIFNGEEDGDWREFVDCNTLIVKNIKLRP